MVNTVVNSHKKRTTRAVKNRPHLGQHFLASRGVLLKIVRAAGVIESDTVLEIGPGKGVLTRELLATARKVIAIEKDPNLVAFLNETFAEDIADGTLSVIAADARDYDPIAWGLRERYILVGNIPYYITGQLFRLALGSNTPPRRAVFLIQKDVADRIMERDGKSSLLSIAVRAYATPRVVASVPPGAFNPPPKVTSAIIELDDISKNFFEHLDEKKFFEFLHAGFAHKRKRLLGNLSALYTKEKLATAFETLGLKTTARAEELDTEMWKKLCETLERGE